MQNLRKQEEIFDRKIIKGELTGKAQGTENEN